MRISVSALCALALSMVAMQGGAANAVPLSPRPLASPVDSLVQTVGYRTYHRTHRTCGKHGYKRRYKHGYRHRTCRKGWLPPLKEYRHLPGKWSHSRCKHKDWYRCHYYFYGYEQWVKWNPEKSRAYFRSRYHH